MNLPLATSISLIIGSIIVIILFLAVFRPNIDKKIRLIKEGRNPNLLTVEQKKQISDLEQKRKDYSFLGYIMFLPMILGAITIPLNVKQNNFSYNKN